MVALVPLRSSRGSMQAIRRSGETAWPTARHVRMENSATRRPLFKFSNTTALPVSWHRETRASWNDLKFRWMVRAPMSIASRFTGLRQLPLAMSQIAYKCVRSTRGDRACAQYGASSCHPGILDHLDYGQNSLVLPPQHSCPSDNEGSQQTWQSKPHYL